MSQLSCKPPQKSFLLYGYRVCFLFLKHLKMSLTACLSAAFQGTTEVTRL